mmetsp:Transcript_59889/g.155764  ORF Transcript_59889/g.155764 Transcript_59889/m.155764 type:complete len:165 (+) Transcript_59889:1-495(+)
MKLGPPAVREQAVGVLRNLTGGGKPENKAAVAEANAIPTLITVLRMVSPEVQVHIAVILYNLANNSAERRNIIATAGGVPALAALLAEGVPEVQKEAVDTLRVLVVGSQQFCMDVAASGAFKDLAAMLKSTVPEVKKRAGLLRDALAKHGGRGVKAALESAKAI